MCESGASATLFYLCESGASATLFYLCESGAATTMFYLCESRAATLAEKTARRSKIPIIADNIEKIQIYFSTLKKQSPHILKEGSVIYSNTLLNFIM
ncbi:hypothetical protein [Lysinibacillus xylanilyticus]|uniref:hypothetical protein n=1 Tax=Lysinibacillus xylanilyticus TaxID=582475 RepID=UPI003818B9C1